MISDPTRLSVLFLSEKECSVGNIAISLGHGTVCYFSSIKNVERRTLSKIRREGKSMIYSLGDPSYVFSILEQVLTHVSELEK